MTTMRKLAFVLLVASSSVAGAQSDSAAAVAVAQRLLDAINTRDTSIARAVLHPGAQFVAARSTPAGATPRWTADTAFIRSLSTGQQKYLERMWSPLVRIRGAIAEVWAPYDFYVDGKFSHCGIDTFTLFKTPAGWKIAAVSYTTEATGCEPSPLGPPK